MSASTYDTDRVECKLLDSAGMFGIMSRLKVRGLQLKATSRSQIKDHGVAAQSDV